jgi:hypothetical protein
MVVSTLVAFEPHTSEERAACLPRLGIVNGSPASCFRLEVG